MNWQPSPGAMPPGVRAYAIGDVHGCAARLTALHRMIAADAAARPAEALVVHLGDLIDKGDDPPGALDAAMRGVHGLPSVTLRGNHEQLLLDAIAGDTGALLDFLAWGGRTTLHGYGIAEDAAPATWAARIPDAHLRFIRSLPLSHRLGGYVFVHAGLRPGVAFEDQSPADLTCIRGTFLHNEADHGAVVVHGHTAFGEPQVRRNRIGVDTAAWSGGLLTCAVLEGERVGFLTA